MIMHHSANSLGNKQNSGNVYFAPLSSTALYNLIPIAALTQRTWPTDLPQITN